MAKVFVSHAAADKEFVDPFVDNILRIGLGLNSEKIFYSSERDTGVPSGADLMNYVRREVGDSTLVVAIITPMYQTRPVCIAELGAAWGRADPSFVFPLLAPGVKRSELEGVLGPMTTLSIDDPAALDELSDRIEQSWKTPVSKMQWGVGRRKWLAAVKTAGPKLKQPELPSAQDHQALLAERDELSNALDLTEREVADWKQKFDQLVMSKSKDPATVRAIRAGNTAPEKLSHAVDEVKAALRKVPMPVHEVIYRSLHGERTPYPSQFDDPLGAKEFDDAMDRKLIDDPYDDGQFAPNQNKPRVKAAMDAVDRLQALLTSGDDSDFDDWFSGEYPHYIPDLADRDCWDGLLD